jgi:hypothetical protein
MSQPKRCRSPDGQQASNEASPCQPRPRSAATAFDSASDTASDTPALPNRRAFSSVVWSASMLADVLDDDGDDAPKKNKFLSPTIVSCLRVDGFGPDPKPFYLPIQIDTVMQSIAVWWPSTAAALWSGQKTGEGGHADALRAMIRIDTINGGDWDLTPVLIVTGPADATSWGPERVTRWTEDFVAAHVRANA